MSRWFLLLIMSGIVLVVAAALISPLVAPQMVLPASTATPPLVSQAEDEQESAQALPPPPHLVDLRQSLQLHLTEEWQTTWHSAAEIGEALQSSAAGQSKPLHQAATTLQRALADETMLLSGRYQTRGNQVEHATLLIYAVPRNGLSLERYLQDLEGQLAAQGAEVTGTPISAAYRSDRLPVGMLHYTLPVQPETGAQFRGIQLVTMDRGAKRLIVFTITTSADAAIDLDARIREVMAGSTL